MPPDPPADATLWRPIQRPPMAVLTVRDDGLDTGEEIRLRGDRFIIGRTDGDLIIPHDAMISPRHAVIVRQQVNGLWRFIVADLNSAHGMYVRLSRTRLIDGRELLVGSGRYRFNSPPATPPTLTELHGRRDGTQITLTGPDTWIGSDPTCDIVRADDRFCAPRQLRIHLTPAGWIAEHPKTRNGLWVRMARAIVERTLQFQLGEQRFKLSI